MTIRTLDGRVIILNESVEIIRVDESLDKDKKYCLYFQSINDKSKTIKVYEDNDDDRLWCVFCQAVGLLRSRNTALLDFEAMGTNPDLEDYQTDTIDWNKKRKPAKTTMKNRW